MFILGSLSKFITSNHFMSTRRDRRVREKMMCHIPENEERENVLSRQYSYIVYFKSLNLQIFLGDSRTHWKSTCSSRCSQQLSSGSFTSFYREFESLSLWRRRSVIFCRWITPFCVWESEVVTKEASTMAPFNATTPRHTHCVLHSASSPSLMRVTRRRQLTLA